MVVLTVAIAVFALLELANVATLYFMPGSRKANGVGVFAAWERSKADPELHRFVRYLVYWVAGTKLIFLALLGVVLVVGSDQARTAAAFVLALSIAVFFWRMFPLAREMDAAGQMHPAGYSRFLGVMIGVMVAVFAIVAVMSI